MKKYKEVLRVGFMLILYASPLHAAPFCVEKQGIPAECSYYDAAQCRNRAVQLSGLCTANPSELHLQPGVGKYCVVTSGRVSLCNYSDRSSCEADAVRAGAVCIEFPSTNVQQDPYRLDPNSKY